MPRPRLLEDGLVLDRALTVFWRRGYAATSVRELSQATGLGAAALYNRFTDKDGLFVEALHRYAEEGMTRRLARLSALADPARAITGYLDELIDLSVKDEARCGCMLVNTALDGATVPPAALEFVRRCFGEIEAFFHIQLRRLDLAGAGIDLAALEQSLFSAMVTIRVLARLDPDRERLQRVADSALTPLLRHRKALAH